VIRAGIVGATGYGGRELLRLFANHPEVRLTAAASTSVAGQRLDAVLPAFRGIYDLEFDSFDAAALAAACDVVFIAVPSKESMEPVAELRAEGVRVIDIGPDFRLKRLKDFIAYYGTDHRAPHLVQEAVYGLPPWYREALKGASLVAVPGCYPISVILPLRPLLDAPLSETPIVIDAISGISGAGRAHNETYHFPEMNENLRAYKLAKHQHVPEIEQELQHRAMVQFSPHVAPLTRGILSTITVRPRELFDPAPYYACYGDEPFVRVLGAGQLAEVKHVRGSNFCDFGWVVDERTGNLIIVSAIDNLMGGTAGMAVQCMNLMFGLEETLGLRYGGMAP
jgi:N-acetyl-gamma-glutamyl-phosphate reductase